MRNNAASGLFVPRAGGLPRLGPSYFSCAYTSGFKIPT